MNRRNFIGGCAAISLLRRAAAQHVPLRKASVTRVFRAPEGHPNALVATPEGLWSADQVSDAAYLLDWKSGAVLKKVSTESSNTSAMAYGGGYLWLGANGGPVMRKARPTDSGGYRILKVDPEDGRTIGEYPTPDGGAIRGLLYAEDSLWVTSYTWNAITRFNPDTMEVTHKFPLQLPSAHGIAWDAPAMWIVYQKARLFMKQDVHSGKVLEIVSLQRDVDPVPHGIALHEGKLYFCDAGLEAGAFGDLPDESPNAGYIFSIDLASAHR